jgi:microcompartment protein CcmL/EutN
MTTMSETKAIGAVELSSIGKGFEVLDAMLKAAAVEVLLSRTICSGKYFIVIGGSVSDVTSALAAAAPAAGEAMIDEHLIPDVHPSVFPAMGQSVELDTSDVDAMGVIETFGAVATIAAADAAAKAGGVTLFRIHLAMALGGKGFCQMTGSLGDVQAAVKAGADDARARGLLVTDTVIARPERELFEEYL